MDKKTFGDNEIKKRKFHCHKSLILTRFLLVRRVLNILSVTKIMKR